MIKKLIKTYKPRIKGAFGETVFEAASFLGFGREWRVLNDIVIPGVQRETTQIDQIAISKTGIFVIEFKNFKGWIYGSADDARWTQTLFTEKHRFYNPLKQNYNHIRALIALTGLPESVFQSVIVFAGEVQFKTEMPKNVMKGLEYIQYIKSFEPIHLNEEEIHGILTVIQENRLTAKDHRSHIQSIKEKLKHSEIQKEKPQTTDQGFCIRCHSGIRMDPRYPFCPDCFRIWNQYQNPYYKESHCHSCGKPSTTSMKKPFCYSCYNRLRP